MEDRNSTIRHISNRLGREGSRALAEAVYDELDDYEKVFLPWWDGGYSQEEWLAIVEAGQSALDAQAEDAAEERRERADVGLCDETAHFRCES